MAWHSLKKLGPQQPTSSEISVRIKRKEIGLSHRSPTCPAPRAGRQQGLRSPDANPINCSCDGPEGGHKTWVHEQGLQTNQGSSSAKTLMTHSLNKEASQLLCEAMQYRVEDGQASAEAWKDSNGIALAPDCFWNSGIESDIAGDDEGPCMGIELNIWERMKVSKLLYVY